MPRERRCAYCGTTRGLFHLDHVVPRARGGPDDPSNLVDACERCNVSKSDRLPSEWMRVVPSAVARIERAVSERVVVRVRKRRKDRTVVGVDCDVCGNAITNPNEAYLGWWSDPDWSPGEPRQMRGVAVAHHPPGRECYLKVVQVERTYHLSDGPLTWATGRSAWSTLRLVQERYELSDMKVFRRMLEIFDALSTWPTDFPESMPSQERTERLEDESIARREMWDSFGVSK